MPPGEGKRLGKASEARDAKVRGKKRKNGASEPRPASHEFGVKMAHWKRGVKWRGKKAGEKGYACRVHAK